jgi:mannose-1-phosphate guanylyltransferase
MNKEKDLSIKEAIILAGGHGKRMGTLTKKIPKCLVPINKKPLLEYQKEFLRKQGIKRIILACGYKWKTIQKKYGKEFIYSVEKEPLGTGGAIKKALKYIKGKEFFVINCDEYTDLNLKKVEKMGSNTMVLSNFNCNFGLAETKGKKIIQFNQKPILPHWANMGIYLLNKKINLPEKGSMEEETFPDLIKKGKLKAYKHLGIWFTVNNLKDKEELEKFLKK